MRVLEGKVPSDLKGDLYRNTVSNQVRNGEEVKHLFDGDGVVVNVNFEGGEAYGQQSFVKTREYLHEEKEGRYLYGSIGRLPNREVLKYFKGPWMSYAIKNSSNTSVLALEDKVLSLWEGGHPYSLDRKTLETKGLDQIGGLKAGHSFSAHPKIDPLTGHIFNIGTTNRRDICLYEMNSKGELLRQGLLKNERKGSDLFVHDMCLAG